MSAVTLNSILNCPAPKSVIFASFLQDPQLSRVSKAFQNANRDAMALIGSRIALDDNASVEATRARANEICGTQDHEETLARLYNELSTQIREIPLDNDPARAIAFRTHWEKISTAYAQMRQHGAPHLNDRSVDRFIIFLDTLKRIFADSPPEQALVPFALEARNFLIPYHMAFLFKATASSFPAFHARQREEAVFSADLRNRFEQLEKRSFSVERFHKAGEIIHDAEFELDLALSTIWRDVRPVINAGPALDATAANIRAWMNDAANHAALEPLQFLTRDNLRTCPPEIGLLSNMDYLALTHGTITALPQELANLSNLFMLDLSHQRFREVPEVIGQIPRLWLLNLNNNPDLRTISDDFARNFLTWRTFLADALLGSLWLNVGINGVNFSEWRDQHFFGARDHLTDVPFCLWFRDRFSIPHIPLMGAYAIAFAWLYIFANAFQQPLAFLRGISELLFWPAFFITSLLMAPLVWLTVSLLLLDLPIFLFNGLLAFAIEPLVTMARDAMSYDRMVHLRDEPAQAEQA